MKCDFCNKNFYDKSNLTNLYANLILNISDFECYYLNG